MLRLLWTERVRLVQPVSMRHLAAVCLVAASACAHARHEAPSCPPPRPARLVPGAEYLQVNVTTVFPCSETAKADILLPTDDGAEGTIILGSGCKGYEAGLPISLKVRSGDPIQLVVSSPVDSTARLEGAVAIDLAGELKGAKVSVRSYSFRAPKPGP